MRRFVLMLLGVFAATFVQADEADETVALINSRLSADPFYDTHGYSIAMPSACIVELIPRGSRFGSRQRQRIALHVLDRSLAQDLDWSAPGAGGWVRLVGRPEGTSMRKGFPATPDLNEKGFPKDPEAMLTYGIQLRFRRRDAARDVAQAFVYLATLCVDRPDGLD